MFFDPFFEKEKSEKRDPASHASSRSNQPVFQMSVSVLLTFHTLYAEAGFTGVVWEQWTGNVSDSPVSDPHQTGLYADMSIGEWISGNTTCTEVENQGKMTKRIEFPKTLLISPVEVTPSKADCDRKARSQSQVLDLIPDLGNLDVVGEQIISQAKRRLAVFRAEPDEKVNRDESKETAQSNDNAVNRTCPACGVSMDNAMPWEYGGLHSVWHLKPALSLRKKGVGQRLRDNEIIVA